MHFISVKFCTNTIAMLAHDDETFCQSESKTNPNMKAFNILRHYKRINITNGLFIVRFIKRTLTKSRQ